MFSIIVPTYNEADQIAKTIEKIHAAIAKSAAMGSSYASEVIVVDGGSTDSTVALAINSGAMVIESDRKGRAAQMNKGASIAKNDILYFLHADSVPPVDFQSQILSAYGAGLTCGCFRLAFDYSHWFLKANAWFTRFDINGFRFGDQSLFVTRDVFKKSGGFREDMLVMEDQEIIHRLKRYGKFKVLNDFVITSARKYLDNGVIRMQGIFYRVWAMYYLRFSQQQMINVYKRSIKKHKM